MSTKAVNEMREKLAQSGKELYNKGLVKGNSGNISARIPKTETFLIKPSGAHMEHLKPEELILVDLEGKRLTENNPCPRRRLCTQQSTKHAKTPKRSCTLMHLQQQPSASQEKKFVHYKMKCSCFFQGRAHRAF